MTCAPPEIDLAHARVGGDLAGRAFEQDASADHHDDAAREPEHEVHVVLDEQHRDIAVLFIEHDMNFVFRFASRIIVMVGGRILLEGAPGEIAADPRVREVYLGRSARHAAA